MPPAKKAAAGDERLWLLVHDVLITGITSSGGTIPVGQEMRRVVRTCRTAIEEMDNPTPEPKPKKRVEGDSEDDGAEMVAEDNLE